MNRLRVRTHWIFDVAAWVCIPLLALFALAAWYQGQVIAALGFLFLAGLGILPLFIVGTIETALDTVTYKCRLGQYQMRWEEIDRIEADPYNRAITFRGNDKQLGILGVSCWWGRDKEEMAIFLLTQIQVHDIEVKPRKWAGFRRSRNAKI
jgi:hypothetical protein